MSCFNNFYKNIRNFIKNIKGKITHNKMKLIEKEYFDLAPVDEIENGEEYLNTLLWAIKSKRIKNIALTGPYGSGKSSIISAFLKKHRLMKRKHIRISMSTFCELIEEKIDSDEKNVTQDGKTNNANDINDGGPSKGLRNHIVKNIIDVDENRIEEGILKQLFYKVSYKKIPQSRFRKIHNINLFQTLIYINIAVIFSLIITFVFFNNVYDTLLNQIIEAGSIFNNKIITIIITVILGELCCASLALFWKKCCHNIRIREIKIGDNSLKSSEEDKESVFNKYMDEIIYFFEATGYRLVFFEDLDRFKSTEIFIKLRELNTILNNCDFIHHKITFVYAVKDDIFAEDDRTKFFDFIIPVIPIVNSTNSGDVLIKTFPVDKFEISKEYILDISPYISDMRMINNIYNEFIFYKKLNLLNLNDEKFLSLIIFKNLYPKDFADLQMEKGIVKEAFIHKNNFVKEQKSRLIEDNIKINEEIDKINLEHLKSIKELKLTFLNEITDFKGQVYRIEIYNGTSSLFIHSADFLVDSYNLKALMNAQYDKYEVYYTDYDGRESTDYLSNFSMKYSIFIERVKLVSESKKDKIGKLKDKIQLNKEKENKLALQSLKQLIDTYDVDKTLPDSVKLNNLLTFMLRRGYIDEEYFNYINYFKGVTITENDMNFILSVKNQVPKSFYYALDDPNKIIDKLSQHEFESQAIYNIDIMNCLLSNEKYKYKLNETIKNLKKADPNSVSFIVKYVNSFLSGIPNPFMEVYSKERLPIYLHYHVEEIFDTCREFCNAKAALLKPLFNQSSGLFKEVFFSDNYSTTEKIIFCTSFLYCSDINTIEKANIDDSISEFIQNNALILNGFSMLKNDKLMEILKVINISFDSFSLFNVNDKNNELIEYIIYSCMYKININTIGFIVNYKNPLLYSDLKYKNYTTIKKLNYQPLIDYIDTNFEDYIENIFLLPKNTQESKKTVIDVLNKLKFNASLSQAVINHEDVVIGSFSYLKKNFIKGNSDNVKMVWNELILQKKIKCSWNNIYQYWIYFGFTKQLEYFVIQNIQKLKKEKTGKRKIKFVLDFINSDIKSSVVDELLPCFNMKCYAISNFKASIDYDSLRKMIINNMIYPNEENSKFIIANYPDLVLDFETKKVQHFNTVL